jgi:polyhydroxyalkanoate synthesis repressor PhaR
MATPIILKKYGNRRLYDARRSGYVTLAEVEEMIAAGEQVQVIDAKSGEDLTNSVLVQIILEREESRDALPRAFLEQVIRVGKTPMREQFKRNVQGMLDGFLDAQRALLGAQQKAVGQQMGGFPFNMMANPFAAFAPPPPRVEPIAPAGEGQELSRLREELAETQSLVRELIRAQAAPAQEPPAPKKKKRKKAAKKKAKARSKKA